MFQVCYQSHKFLEEETISLLSLFFSVWILLIQTFFVLPFVCYILWQLKMAKVILQVNVVSTNSQVFFKKHKTF